MFEASFFREVGRCIREGGTYKPNSLESVASHTRGETEPRKNSSPVAIIRTSLRPQQRLLPRLIRKISPDLITVFFGLEEGSQVDPRPHLLAAKFAGDGE